eukprot:gene28464-35319_t
MYYNETYATPMNSSFLNSSCFHDPNDVVFVCSVNDDEAELTSIGAFGYASDVFAPTTSHNLAVEHNGAYWYHVSGLAFGFSDASNVYLVAIMGDMLPGDNRLSWSLDTSGGGYRSGSSTQLLTPSLLPSMAPTMIPSLTPSLTPSVKPSMLPSVEPSKRPTAVPTTSSPTITPTTLPSKIPTQSPTARATKLPTLRPSEFPSRIPSVMPSMDPSFTPSQKPSFVPSKAPTNVATIVTLRATLVLSGVTSAQVNSSMTAQTALTAAVQSLSTADSSLASGVNVTFVSALDLSSSTVLIVFDYHSVAVALCGTNCFDGTFCVAVRRPNNHNAFTAAKHYHSFVHAYV